MVSLPLRHVQNRVRAGKTRSVTSQAPQPTVDERSFERLYREHRGDVYRFVLRDVGNREEAEDVTQTAFLNAYNAYMRGGAPEQPRAWLFAIAQNVGRRRFRVRSVRPIETPLDEEAAAARTPEDVPTAQEIGEAMATLPFNQRAALVLREVSGLSYAEIANELALSVSAVQMLIFRARRSLRLELEPARDRRRVVGGIFGLPLPSWLSKLFAPVASTIGRTGLVTKAASVVGAAAVGTGALATSPGRAELPGLSRAQSSQQQPPAPPIPASNRAVSAVRVAGSASVAGQGPGPATSAKAQVKRSSRRGTGAQPAGKPGTSTTASPSAAVQNSQAPAGATPVVQVPVEVPPNSLGSVRPPSVTPPELPKVPPLPSLPALPPPPPVSTPPVSVPTLPSPPVSVPTLPIPPVSVPTVPVPPPPTLPIP